MGTSVSYKKECKCLQKPVNTSDCKPLNTVDNWVIFLINHHFVVQSWSIIIESLSHGGIIERERGDDFFIRTPIKKNSKNIPGLDFRRRKKLFLY